MSGAYYNEIEPYAAQWLRNLIKEGLIADGEVDTRSIVDVRPGDLDGFGQCHFFAGLGGWSGALRRAGVADADPIWTGSCPCQPFSLAGKQKGFADDRHLWPVWRELIRERRPAKVFGEQVASATEWLGLVRSDLEALGYAVGAIPVEAASAGADHLRDRYWFVANDGSGRCAGPRERQSEQPWRAEAVSASNIGLAGADEFGTSAEWQQRSGQQRGPGCDQEARDSGNVAEPFGSDQRGYAANTRGETGPGSSEAWSPDGNAIDGSRAGRLEWVNGADGKARRVKPGICLLAHGVPARVAKLRALGNAIDLRPAAEFIKAAMTVTAC